MKMFQQLSSMKRWIMTAGAVVVLAVMLGIGAHIALACTVGNPCTGCCGGNGCTGCGLLDSHSDCCTGNFTGSACPACCNQGNSGAVATCKSNCK